MNLSGLVVQLLNGLSGASSLFLVSAGLSLIFGVTRIVNFAHGSFYMVGIYVAYSLVAQLGADGLYHSVDQGVAGGMTESVVHLFQVVQVDQQQGAGAIVDPCVREGCCADFFQFAAIVQPGQDIGGSQFF